MEIHFCHVAPAVLCTAGVPLELGRCISPLYFLFLTHRLAVSVLSCPAGDIPRILTISFLVVACFSLRQSSKSGISLEHLSCLSCHHCKYSLLVRWSWQKAIPISRNKMNTEISAAWILPAGLCFLLLKIIFFTL